MSSRIPVLVAIALLAATTACNKDSGAGTGGAASATTTTSAALVTPEIKEMFKQRCASCHGETGHGDGPAAAALNPKPRAYSDQAWQDKVTDQDIKNTITMGGAAVGKSPIMPASPDLTDKPELDGLVAYVRSFKNK